MKDHAIKSFTMMATAYPAWAEKFDRAMIETWGSFVEELPAEILEEAISRLVRSCKFPPSPAEIHEMANKVRFERRHDGRTIAEIMAEARKGGV